MKFMDRSGAPRDSDYPVFERALLASARADGPQPEAAKQAWTKFAIAMSAAGAAAPMVGNVASLSRGRLARVVALKWLVLGAVGGSGLTVLWMNPRATVEKSPPAAAVSPPSSSPRANDVRLLDSEISNATRERTEEATKGSAEAPTVSVRPRRPGSVLRKAAASMPSRPGRVATSETSEATEQRGQSDRASNLAAEVALIDAARSAISKRAYGDALRLVGRYRKDFPTGELARDVDVVAIEALAAGGDWPGAATQGRQFLERHPQDPQVPRIKALIAR